MKFPQFCFGTSSLVIIFFCRQCFNSTPLVVNLTLISWRSLTLNIKHSISISDLHYLNQGWKPGTMLSQTSCKLTSLALELSAFSASASSFRNKISFWSPYISAIIWEGSFVIYTKQTYHHYFPYFVYNTCFLHLWIIISYLKRKSFLQFMI